MDKILLSDKNHPGDLLFLYRDANIIIIKVVMKVFSDLTTSFLDLSPIPFFWW